MQIWVDADACPVVIKEILFKAAQRCKIITTFVANRPVATPPSPYIAAIQVASGIDMADLEIIKRVTGGDIVITSDIPLAAEAIAKGALGLSPRGELFTESNIQARLTMRDFLESMRSSGINSPGPPALSHNDRKQFADQLDRWLAHRQVGSA